MEKVLRKLPLSNLKKDQIESEYISTLTFMERMGSKNRLLNDISNVVVILLSAIVPVLINYSDATSKLPEYLGWATILSVLLAIGNAFRQSYKYREKWQNYFRTTELLLIEGQNYFALAGLYAKFSTHEDAFVSFVNNISKLRISQVNEYQATTEPESDVIIQQRINDQLLHQMEIVKKKQSSFLKISQINQEINDYVKNEPAISYHEVDHELKKITLFLNDSNFSSQEKIKFNSQGVAETPYRIEIRDSDVEIHGVFRGSSGIKNQQMPIRDFGSMGCLCLQGSNVVFISCYHVVKHDSQDWDLFIPGKFDNVITTDGTEVGKILEAEKTDTLDIAIMKISDQIAFENRLPGNLVIKNDLVYLDEENYKQYQDVYIVSRTRDFAKIQGKLAQINKPVTLNYGTKQNKDMKTLVDLMIIHNVSTQSFSKVGDSGSLVFTGTGIPIGIVVGGDGKRCSFAIPFPTIANRFNLSIL